MKPLTFYTSHNLTTSNEVFDYLIKTLKPSNMLFSYFVDWKKVFSNVEEFEIKLNTFNYLIGKENFDEAFAQLVKSDPSLIKLIPVLLVRDGHSGNKFKILASYDNMKMVYKDYDFSKTILSDKDIEDYVELFDKTGLKNLIVNKKIKNFVDYTIGVEAGLNSNARKNRGGDVMEKITEAFIKEFCLNNGYKYIIQADSKKIYNNFGVDVPVYVDQKGVVKERKYDFVVKTPKELIMIECNFYAGGGSKLKSTAEEY